MKKMSVKATLKFLSNETKNTTDIAISTTEENNGFICASEREKKELFFLQNTFTFFLFRAGGGTLLVKLVYHIQFWSLIDR